MAARVPSIRRRLVQDRRAAAQALLLALAASAAVSLLCPAPANALVSEAVESAVRGVLGWTFENIMFGLFGRVSARVTQNLIAWLVEVPNFKPNAPNLVYQDYVRGAPKSNLDDAVMGTSMLSLGALGAVMSLSAARYWLSGMSIRGSGGIEALEGIMRSGLAAGLIFIWPDSFRLLVALTNSFTRALLSLPSVTHNLAVMLGGGAVTNNMLSIDAPVAVVISIIVYVGLALTLLALVVLKVFLTAGLAVVYVGMPVAIVLWPLPETAWVVGALGRGFMVCLLVPAGWAVVFVTFSAVGADYFMYQGDSAIDHSLIRPLVVLTMLGLTIVLPKAMARAAMMSAVNPTSGAGGAPLGGGRGGGGVGGGVGRTLTAPLRAIGAAQRAVQMGADFGAARGAAIKAGASGSGLGAGVLGVLGISPKAQPPEVPGPDAPPNPPRDPETPRRTPEPQWRPSSDSADLADAHTPSPQSLKALRVQLARMRAGHGDLDQAPEGFAEQLNQEHPHIGALHREQPGEMSAAGLAGLGSPEQAKIYDATFDSQLSDQGWESYMLAQATNPAYASSEQQAWFRVAVGGRQGMVDQAARAEFDQPGSTWSDDDDPVPR